MSAGRVTKAQRRKAAREWRKAEALLRKAVTFLELADAALLAGELATRHRHEVQELRDAVSNEASNIGYAAGEEEWVANL